MLISTPRECPGYWQAQLSKEWFRGEKSVVQVSILCNLLIPRNRAVPVLDLNNVGPRSCFSLGPGRLGAWLGAGEAGGLLGTMFGPGTVFFLKGINSAFVVPVVG